MSLMEKMLSRIQKKPVREKVRYALYRLRMQSDKLEDTMLRLQQKDRDMFQRCVAAQLSTDNPRAEMYASECADIRKMARVVLGSKIALERAVLRLETVEQFGDVLMEMAPVIGVVKETRDKIEGVIPEVADELQQINDVLDEVVLGVGEVNEPIVHLVPTGEEAKRVLEESSASAEEQIRRQFPEIPTFEHSAPLTEAEGFVNGPRFESRETITAVAPPEFRLDTPSQTPCLEPPVLLAFIEQHVQSGGVLNLSKCAQHFGVQRDDVMKAVQRLRADGKIVTP
ncbi:MAG: Snf7 family protein [archaeon]